MSGSISSRELQLEAVGRHGSIIRSCDHVGFPSKVPHVKNMDNFFGLGTVWSKKSLKVLTKKEKVQMEKAVVAFCIKKVVQN